MKTVSVVISNYNYAKYLPEALDSVLVQTHPATEIIVVDDGSTDGSAEILREYARKHPLIRPILQENGGQGAAMNAGVGNSVCDVILFMDSDDLWHPEKIRSVLPLLDDCGFVQHNLSCGDRLYRSFLVSQDHRRYMFEFGMFDFFVPTSGLCLRRDIAEKVFPLPGDDSLRICADAYVTRLALCYSPLVTIQDSLGVYRVHGENNWTGNRNRTHDKIPNIIKLINERLEERGEERIPLHRNWVWYGEDAEETDRSFAVIEALKREPGHEISATALEGYLHIALDQYGEAIEDFRHVVENWGIMNYAHCMGKEMKRIVELDEGKTDAMDATLNKVYHQLGQCLQVAGEPDEALATLKKGIDGASMAASDVDGISPKEMANTYYNMAVCYIRLKWYEDALDAFAGVLENDPERLEIYLNRSDCLRYLSRYDEALAEVDKANALDPDFPNLEETRQKVRHAMVGDGIAPPPKKRCKIQIGFNIQLQTTSVCNGKCIMCPYLDSWHKKNPGVMTDDVFDRIVSQLGTIPLDKICMYLENEPLVDPKILPRIEQVIEKLFFNLMEISTNASLLTRDRADTLAKLFTDIPHQILISFHGVDKRSYEGTMGLDFEKTLSNVIYLLQLAQNTQLNITVRGGGEPLVSSLGHPYNFSEKEYRTFWENQFEEHGLGKRPRIDFFKYHDRCGTIKRNGIRLTKNVRGSLKGFYCPRIDTWLHFLYTGELCICCMDYHREQVFGDITTHNLNEILNSNAYKDMRDTAFGLEDSPHDFICKRCISPNG
jgi:glycosyltransferase involved in cell wall biosynthesis